MSNYSDHLFQPLDEATLNEIGDTKAGTDAINAVKYRMFDHADTLGYMKRHGLDTNHSGMARKIAYDFGNAAKKILGKSGNNTNWIDSKDRATARRIGAHFGTNVLSRYLDKRYS